MNKKILSLLGPTATGKTDVALSLAKKYNGELIACDSRQVYKGLDLGTGKAPGEHAKIEKGEGYWVVNGIKIHLYDEVDPQSQYSVWDYVQAAAKKVKQISREKKLPIIVGGTGFYLDALLYGLDFVNTPAQDDLRKSLEKLDLNKLQNKLSNLSPSFFSSLNNSEKNNKRRLIRKIELLSSPSFTRPDKFEGLAQDYEILKIGLKLKKDELNERINMRLDKRIDQGMIDEAQNLLKTGLSFVRMRQLGLEYALLADLLAGKMSLAEFKIKLKIKIHQYAKRQLTWFINKPNIEWFNISDEKFYKQVEKKVEDWYNA